MASTLSTARRQRAPRTSIVAYTQFNQLTRYVRISENGQVWNLTKPAVLHLQKAVDACMLAILDVAVATMTRKTLTVDDVDRARQFFAVFTGTTTATGPTSSFPATLKMPQKFGVRALKLRHPALYVQQAAAAAMTALYANLVRTALRELNGLAGKRTGPTMVHDVLRRVPCLALIPAPPPSKRRAKAVAKANAANTANAANANTGTKTKTKKSAKTKKKRKRTANAAGGTARKKRTA